MEDNSRRESEGAEGKRRVVTRRKQKRWKGVGTRNGSAGRFETDWNRWLLSFSMKNSSMTCLFNNSTGSDDDDDERYILYLMSLALTWQFLSRREFTFEYIRWWTWTGPCGSHDLFRLINNSSRFCVLDGGSQHGSIVTYIDSVYIYTPFSPLYESPRVVVASACHPGNPFVYIFWNPFSTRPTSFRMYMHMTKNPTIRLRQQKKNKWNFQ